MIDELLLKYNKGSGLREIELSTSCKPVSRHVHQQRRGGAPEFSSYRIEWTAEQDALVDVNQVPARQIPAEVAVALHGLPLAGLQEQDSGAGIVPVDER